MDEIIKKQQTELAELFSIVDVSSHDVRTLPDFFSIIANRSNKELLSNFDWENVSFDVVSSSNIISSLVNAYHKVKNVFLVADWNSISQETREGLRTKQFELLKSKKVAGNFCNNIVNKKTGKVVEQLTLMKAVDNQGVLSDVSSVMTQIGLKQISDQIKGIEASINRIERFQRDHNLYDNIFYAIDRIKLACLTSNETKYEDYMNEAEKSLARGMEHIYMDISECLIQIEEEYRSLLNNNFKNLDKIIAYFSEDICVLPKYIGLRYYILNVLGEKESAENIVISYKKALRRMTGKEEGELLSSFEMIHDLFPYKWHQKNDFWIRTPKIMLNNLEYFSNGILKGKDEILLITRRKVK